MVEAWGRTSDPSTDRRVRPGRIAAGRGAGRRHAGDRVLDDRWCPACLVRWKPGATYTIRAGRRVVGDGAVFLHGASDVRLRRVHPLLLALGSTCRGGLITGLDTNEGWGPGRAGLRKLRVILRPSSHSDLVVGRGDEGAPSQTLSLEEIEQRLSCRWPGYVGVGRVIAVARPIVRRCVASPLVKDRLDQQSPFRIEVTAPLARRVSKLFALSIHRAR